MKTLLILTSFLLMSCASSKKQDIDFEKLTLSETEKQKIRFNLTVTKLLDEDRDPIGKIDTINASVDSKYITYVKLFNLKFKKYNYVINQYDENGKLFDQSSYLFEPTNKSWHVWHTHKINEKMMPRGNIKLEIELNDYVIGSDKIYVK